MSGAAATGGRLPACYSNRSMDDSGSNGSGGVRGGRTGVADRRIARLQPATFSFNAQTGELTIQMKPKTDQGQEYDIALVTITPTEGLMDVDPNAERTVYTGESKTIKLAPTKSGNGQITFKATYKKIIGDVVISEMPDQLLTLEVTKVE